MAANEFAMALPKQGHGGEDLPIQFHVEVANWRDLGSLRRVETECFGDDAWPLLDLAAALTFPNVVRLKAVVGDQMVGFAGGDQRVMENLGWITTLGVLPEFRRKGIAKALLAEAEIRLKSPRVRLCVRKSNDGAIQLYKSCGYLQVGAWPHYYSDGEDAFVLEKRIYSAGELA
jgi:ribosomal protein S18 acetylase RimI-like enzyme